MQETSTGRASGLQPGSRGEVGGNEGAARPRQGGPQGSGEQNGVGRNKPAAADMDAPHRNSVRDRRTVLD
jgi:hypothetical protein